METSLEKVKTRKVRTSAPGKVLEGGTPLTVQAVKEKKSKGEVLAAQEKRLLKQEEKQQLSEVIEKKKRLKNEILIEDESNTYDNFNEFSGGTAEPVDIDDMTLEHILGIPSPEDDEHQRLLTEFGTSDPVEIREIIRQRIASKEYTPVFVDHESITDEYLDHEEWKHQEFSSLGNEHSPNSALEDAFGERIIEEKRKPWLVRVRNFFAGNPQ